MFKKSVFGRRGLGGREAAGSNEIKPLKFEKFARTYADLNYKVFSTLMNNREQVIQELGDGLVYLGVCMASLYKDDLFDVNNGTKKDKFSNIDVVNYSNSKKRIWIFSVEIYYINGILTFKIENLNRNVFDKIYDTEIDDELYFDSVVSSYEAFFEHLIFGRKGSEGCVFLIPKDVLASVGLLSCRGYKRANKNNSGDVIVFEGALK
ncbi:MAG: hypothetical protein ABJN04_11545 [Hyphomicrobiales bacterium]